MGSGTNSNSFSYTSANQPTNIANSAIVITMTTAGGTPAAAPYLTTITPGTGFTVKAGSGDTSVYQYLRIG